MEGEGRRRRRRTYCVTGGSGFIGSSLVKSLLESGHTVHATVRNPERSSYLLSKWNGGSRLKLFKADLLENGSFDEPIKDCDGVFHVAASMEFNVPSQENIESYVQSNLIDPAIKGTLNLLKSCSRSNTVTRVVFTSSISTITAQDNNGAWIPLVDESCRTPVERVWKNKASGWVYALTKLLTEAAAFNFAAENGIDLVSVITTTVGGPFLTSTIPASVRVLLSPITGDVDLFPILLSVSSRMGSMCLVHVDDICRAHVFLMESPRAEGRYMCCAGNCHVLELIDLLNEAYPNPCLERVMCAERGESPSKISSKKLMDLGFVYKYDQLGEIVKQTVKACVECSYLPPIRK